MDFGAACSNHACDAGPTRLAGPVLGLATVQRLARRRAIAHLTQHYDAPRGVVNAVCSCCQHHCGRKADGKFPAL